MSSWEVYADDSSKAGAANKTSDEQVVQSVKKAIANPKMVSFFKNKVVDKVAKKLGLSANSPEILFIMNRFLQEVKARNKGISEGHAISLASVSFLFLYRAMSKQFHDFIKEYNGFGQTADSKKKLLEGFTGILAEALKDEFKMPHYEFSQMIYNNLKRSILWTFISDNETMKRAINLSYQVMGKRQSAAMTIVEEINFCFLIPWTIAAVGLSLASLAVIFSPLIAVILSLLSLSVLQWSKYVDYADDFAVFFAKIGLKRAGLVKSTGVFGLGGWVPGDKSESLLSKYDRSLYGLVS